MDRVRERLNVARRALMSFQELPLDETPSKIIRDAAIQRFEYSFEACWKAAQMYLRRVEGLDVGSPKGTIRVSLQVGLLAEDQTEQALAMADDRNLTVHTYNEVLAQQIFAQLESYARLLDIWLTGMEESL